MQHTAVEFYLFQMEVKTIHILLPAPIAGSVFRFVYAGGAADATDAIIVTPGNTNFFIGGVTFLDQDNEVSSVFSERWKLKQ